VQTADGSPTLWSGEFGESYHSVSAGALEEALKKFLLPSHLPFLVRERDGVSLLEVGFGLGYNLTVTAVELLKVNPSVRVRYWGLERSLSPLLWELRLPPPYGEFYELLKENLKRGKERFRIGPVEVNLLFGDARREVVRVEETVDAVYHDAFSPKRNAELWTLQFLEKLKERLRPEGFWVSYSAALPVRRALAVLGFEVFSTEPVGRRSPGTAATLRGRAVCERVRPLSEKERRKLETSPRAVPLEDPCLCLPREVIWENYLRRVSEREGKPLG